MQSPRPTVPGAVTACLAFCKDSPDRDTIVALFIKRLHENPDWTTEEVAEIQRQIEARLSENSAHPAATFAQNSAGSRNS